MSSVSGVGSTQQSLLDQLKSSQDQTNQQQGWNSRLEDLLKGAGVDPTKIPALEQQIQAAATAARQSAGSPADARTSVKQAVDKVLQDNGVDPSKLQTSAQKSGRGRGGHRAHNAQGNGAASAIPGAPTTTTTPATDAQSILNGTLTAGLQQVDVEG